MSIHRVAWSSEPIGTIPGIPLRAYDTEIAMQSYCADWLRKRYAVTGDDRYRYWHHSANERSNPREGFIAKMMGQSKGFPDFIHIGTRLALELKLPAGKVSPEQVDWLDYLQAQGWFAEVVRDAARFKTIVEGRHNGRPGG